MGLLSVVTRIQGQADNGAAADGYPVWVAGWDGATVRALRTDSNGQMLVATSGGALSAQVEGTTLDGSSAAGVRPVIVSGVDGSGNNQSLLSDTSGRIQCIVGSTSTPADSIANSQFGGVFGPNGASNGALVVTSEFNRATWDRRRNNSDTTLFASAARTATPSAATFTVYNEGFLAVVIDVTAITAAPSVVFNIEALDTVSGQWVLLLASAAIVAVGTTTLKVGVGLTAAANLTANDFLRRNLRCRPVHANADSITYSVGMQLSVDG